MSGALIPQRFGSQNTNAPHLFIYVNFFIINTQTRPSYGTYILLFLTTINNKHCWMSNSSSRFSAFLFDKFNDRVVLCTLLRLEWKNPIKFLQRTARMVAGPLLSSKILTRFVDGKLCRNDSIVREQAILERYA